MTTPQPRPSLGSEVLQTQVMVQLSGPPRERGHSIVLVDRITREIVSTVTMRPGHSFSLFTPTYIPLPSQAWIYWGSSHDENGVVSPVIGRNLRTGSYLHYAPTDGTPLDGSLDPVNQFAIGPKWKDILSRFAHDVMAFNPSSNHLRDGSTHASGHLPPTDAAAMLKNKATYQLGRAVVGVAFHRISEWMKLDAERLAQYPVTVSDGQNWKVWLDGAIPVATGEIPHPNMSDMMAMICGDQVKEVAGLCVGAWVYLLNERISASDYDTNMNNGGEIRLPNAEWDQWRPYKYLHRVSGTRSERLDQWAEIMGWFRDAHDHYLESVSPSIEHTASN